MISLTADFFYYATSIGMGYEEVLRKSNHYYVYYDENGSNLQLEIDLPTAVESTLGQY
ncbi:MAG: hypothetical protein AB8B56_02040 [Crocinitomicaceae bacterium]